MANIWLEKFVKQPFMSRKFDAPPSSKIYFHDGFGGHSTITWLEINKFIYSGLTFKGEKQKMLKYNGGICS